MVELAGIPLRSKLWKRQALVAASVAAVGNVIFTVDVLNPQN